jgi:hypothetical protein
MPNRVANRLLNTYKIQMLISKYDVAQLQVLIAHSLTEYLGQ